MITAEPEPPVSDCCGVIAIGVGEPTSAGTLYTANVTVPVPESDGSNTIWCVPAVSSVATSRNAPFESPPVFSTEPPGRTIEIVPEVSVVDVIDTATRMPTVPANETSPFWPGTVTATEPVAEEGAGELSEIELVTSAVMS